MRIARVFPHGGKRTKATPIDRYSFIGSPGLFPPEVDEVHISVTFTWDLPEAERLAEAWARIAPVKIGGPATGERSGNFTPGMYLKPGYVITSRGCPNHCWFCSVPKREGNVRELTIAGGWNVLDDNLLACSEEHISAVFNMLRQQRKPIEFTGGLEPKRMTASIANELRVLKPKQVFFAYDTPDDFEPLREAVTMCWNAGFSKAGHRLRAYVLIGFQGDSFDGAERRLRSVLSLGVIPMAMLYRDKTGKADPGWKAFQRQWARVALIGKAAANMVYVQDMRQR